MQIRVQYVLFWGIPGDFLPVRIRSNKNNTIYCLSDNNIQSVLSLYYYYSYQHQQQQQQKTKYIDKLTRDFLHDINTFERVL